MTESNVVVTVYVANYNYGRFLPEAVDSVLRQTFGAFEVVIIDDGSTDDSRSVIERYRDDPRVRIIYQENQGLVKTAALGVRAARGRYVMRLDADDWLDENALLVMTHALDADPRLAMVFPDYFYVDGQGTITGQERRHNFRDVTLLDQPAHGACSLARRDCLIEVDAYSSDITCQDGVDLWLRLVERYPVRNINLPLFFYRRHGENLTEQTERILRQRADIFRRHAERTHKPALDCVAVIPVRGPSVDRRDLSLEGVGDRLLIDWTIAAALEAPSIPSVVVTTPCRDVQEHVRTRWPDVVIAERSIGLAGENVGFAEAVEEAVRQVAPSGPDAVLELTVQFPFRESFYIEKALDVMRIFSVSRVVSVAPEDDVFFHHTGGGLVPVGGESRVKGLRLEREYLFRQAGGLMLRRLGGGDEPEQLGHVVVSKAAAFKVRDASDIGVACALAASPERGPT